MPESPNKGGRKPRVADEDLLEVFRSTSDPVLSTAEVAGQVPIKRRGTLTRLRKLTDEGTLASKQIGGRNTVWWIPDKGQQNSHSRLSEQSGTGEGSSSTDRTDGSSERERVETILRDLDLAGSGIDYERRVESILTMYGFLRENPGERISKGDFEELLEGTEIGYKGGFDSLWSNWVKKNEQYGRPQNILAQLPNVEIRGKEYVYTEG